MNRAQQNIIQRRILDAITRFFPNKKGASMSSKSTPTVHTFKVGDRVRVRKDLVVDQTYGNNIFVESMKKHLGKKAIVRDTRINGNIISIEPCKRFTNEMLEPAPKREKIKIPNWDKLRGQTLSKEQVALWFVQNGSTVGLERRFASFDWIQSDDKMPYFVFEYRLPAAEDKNPKSYVLEKDIEQIIQDAIANQTPVMLRNGEMVYLVREYSHMGGYPIIEGGNSGRRTWTLGGNYISHGCSHNFDIIGVGDESRRLKHMPVGHPIFVRDFCHHDWRKRYFLRIHPLSDVNYPIETLDSEQKAHFLASIGTSKWRYFRLPTRSELRGTSWEDSPFVRDESATGE